ncbi:MAG: GAF domain-containing protein [Chloroflexaceae bacterium]|nr:GAF domain-containing protein [Chloroflexaceae bacterium]
MLELYQLARQLHQSVNLTEMLRTVLAQTLDLAHAEMSCVILLDDRGVPAYWMTSDPGLSLTELSLAAALHDGLQGQSLQRQQTIYVADHLHRGNGQSPLVPGRSFLVVPLSAHGKITGVLTLAHPNPRAFTMQHKALLIEAAEVIGLALHNAQAYTQLHTTTTANDEGKYRLVHDIRSPLMSVSASIEVIRRVLRMDLQDPALQSMIRESVDNAQRSLKAVLDLSNDLLDTKKLQIDQTTIEYQPVVLELLCDEVMGIMRSLALQRHIMLSYPGDTPHPFDDGRCCVATAHARQSHSECVALYARGRHRHPQGGRDYLKRECPAGGRRHWLRRRARRPRTYL